MYNIKQKEMNAKQFQAKVKSLYKRYRLTKDKTSDKRHELQTVFGTFYFYCEWTPRIKVASIHSGLPLATKEQKERFKELSGYDMNTYNGKCNFYSADYEWILDTLEEYLDNIVWLDAEEKDKQNS